MRFVVYGAGAIGGVVGARLFENGHDVVLIARGAHYEAIREHGLRIQSPDDDVTLDDPGRRPSVAARRSRADDVVILAMKSQDTIGACEALARRAPPDIAVACFQNGVENERVVLRHFAATLRRVRDEPDRAHSSPGVVHGAVGARERPARHRPLPDRRRRARRGDRRRAATPSTFHSIPRPDVMRWKYTKLLMNLANSVEATVRARSAASATSSSSCAPRARRACAPRASTSRRAKRTRSAEATAWTCDRSNGEFRGGGSSWQSLRPRHRLDRDRLPQRRDRDARAPARRADAGERAHAANRESIGATKGPAEIDPGRDAARPTCRDSVN